MGQATGRRSASLTGHAGPVTSVAFSPDGKTLASGNTDGTIRMWDMASGRPIGQPPHRPPRRHLSVAFSPDGKTLASGNVDHTVQLWDLAGVSDDLDAG